jgi:hypothetical protein
MSGVIHVHDIGSGVHRILFVHRGVRAGRTPGIVLLRRLGF